MAGLAVLCLAVGAGASPAAAQALPRASQGWEICNETSYITEVAIGRPEARAMMMQGWVRVRPGECRLVLAAPLARGSHALYARTSGAHRGGRRQWGGQERFCVDPNAQFSIENPSDCEAMGLEARQFRMVQIARRDGWRTTLSEAEPYSLYRARAAGIQRLLTDAGFDTREGRRATDPRRTAGAIAQFRTLARLPANASEDQLIDALEAAARRRSNELGLTLCNRSEDTIWAAIARRRGEGWESRGWWSIAAGACARTIDDALVQGVYYVSATLQAADGDRYLAAGGEPFCTSPSRFAILGREDCEDRYYDTGVFSAISARGRQGLVVEFFERDFLPLGQRPRIFTPSSDAASPGADRPADQAPARSPREPTAGQGTIRDLIRSRQSPPEAAEQGRSGG